MEKEMRKLVIELILGLIGIILIGIFASWWAATGVVLLMTSNNMLLNRKFVTKIKKAVENSKPFRAGGD